MIVHNSNKNIIITWTGNDGIGYCGAEVVFGRFLHLGQHHGRYLFGRKLLGLTHVGHLDEWLASLLLNNLERPKLYVLLYFFVREPFRFVIKTQASLMCEHYFLPIIRLASKMVLAGFTAA